MLVADRLTDRELMAMEAQDIVVLRLLYDRDQLAETIEALAPDAAVIETAIGDDSGFKAIEQTRYRSPQLRILARTASPPAHDEVARAMALGAAGFVGVDAPGATLRQALDSVIAGTPYLPVEATATILADAGSDLGLTSAERDSRLRNLVIGLIPLAGLLTAIMSLLWRRYLGQIGVRPVDLAIDPATRLVDAFFALSVLLAVIGPVLFIGSWLDVIEDSVDRRTVRWLTSHRRLARLILTVVVLAVGWALAYLMQIIMALFVGPLIGGLLLAKTFDLDDDLPAALRLTRWDSGRTTIIGGATLLAFLSVLSFEILVIGPDLRTDGAHSWVAADVLGFRAQPMRAITVDDGATREVLYLGGNADLYVLVDPCDDDQVDLVSVGSTRLQVIDRVSC